MLHQFNDNLFLPVEPEPVPRLCPRPRRAQPRQLRHHVDPEERLLAHPKRLNHGPVEQQGKPMQCFL